MRMNRKSMFARKTFLTMISFIFLLSYMSNGLKANAAPDPVTYPATEVKQRGTGILGWQATGYGGGFREEHMKANIDWIADNFLEFGYEYIGIDGWVGDATLHNENGYITHYKNDWVHDWKYWAEYANSKGLKLGIYYNPSWVHASIADDENIKIVGTDIPIKSIVDPNHMHQTRYMIDPTKPGAEEYVKGMINYYKSVGVELLKIDFLRYFDDSYGAEETTKLYRWMREAAGDEMILYYANQKNRNHAQDELIYADIIRASEDFRENTWWHTSMRDRGKVKDDSWPPAYNLFDGFIWLSDISGAGGVSLDGDYSRLSTIGNDAEKKTRLSLLAMAGSGINIGDRYSEINNNGNNSYYYKNWELLDLNKRGFIGKPLSQANNNPLSQIWQGKLPDGTAVAALFNREDTTQTRSINFAETLGLDGDYIVSDMWSHSPLGIMSSYTEDIEPHGTRLLKISKLSMEPYGAFFKDTQQVTLKSVDSESVIRYTTDGSEPTEQSPLYTGPFDINESMTLRAKIMNGDDQGYEAIAMFVKTSTDPIHDLAAVFATITEPEPGRNTLYLPEVPYGYSLSIKSSTHEHVIDKDGKLEWPVFDTTVGLVFEIKRESDGATKDTAVISEVPGKGLGGGIIIAEAESTVFRTSPGQGTSVANNQSGASGNAYLQTSGTTSVGNWIEFDINIFNKGNYAVEFGYKTHNNRGTAQMYVNGKLLGDPIDQYSTSQVLTSKTIGEISVEEPGIHKFKFELVNRNPSSSGNNYTFDYIKLIPLDPTILDLNINTTTGTAPVLPQTVTVYYADSTSEELPVIWDAIAPTAYAEEGTFTIEGTVEGITVKAVAKIMVRDLSPETIAASITTIAAPEKGDIKLTLPTVPDGYTIKIQQTYNNLVIDTNGNIHPPEVDTVVGLVLEITRISDGESAETEIIEVLVPGNATEGEEKIYLYEGETLARATGDDKYKLNPVGLGVKFNNETAASNGQNFQVTFTEPTGQWVEFTLDVPSQGIYEVIYGYKRNDARGIYQTYMDGIALGESIDHYVPTSQSGYSSSSLGSLELEAGKHTVKFEIVGKNPLTTKNNLDFVLDYIKLVQLDDEDETDTEAPVWPEGSELKASDIKQNEVTLTWNAAEDDTHVAHYTVTWGRGKSVTVNGDVHSVVITGLSSATSYTFQVNAGDAAGNWSEDGPTVTANTLAASGSGSSPINSEPVEPGEDEPTENHLRNVIESDLKEIKDGKVSILLNQDETGISLPYHAANMLEGTALELRSGGISVTIPASVLEALSGQVNEEDANGAQIVVRLEPSDEQSLLTAPVEGSTANLKLGDKVYDLSMILLTQDGEEHSLSEFADAVQIVLPYHSNLVDEELIAIYSYNAVAGQWEYIGGEIDKEDHVIHARLNHFSKYAVLEYDKTFTDVAENHWAYRTLKVLTAKQIVNGVTDSRFNPNGQTTRAEFTALLVRALGLKGSNSSIPFTDVQTTDWYSTEVAAAFEAGIIQGVSDSKFAPNEKITREQMATLLVRAYEYSTGQSIHTSNELLSYIDGKKVAAWAKEDVSKAIAIGLMQGKGAGLFDPKSDANRAETAQAIMNLIEKN